MDVRILDLDGALTAQPALADGRRVVDGLQRWGPRIRLACGFGRFRRFEQALADRARRRHATTTPHLTFYGSGDFHHVSLALVRRLREPFNLLVLDNHPDWMCGVPFLHCGTWLRHASLLPLVRRVFHVGGDVDFDNSYRWMAPWRQLREGRIHVLPGLPPLPSRRLVGVPTRTASPGAGRPRRPIARGGAASSPPRRAGQPAALHFAGQGRDGARRGGRQLGFRAIDDGRSRLRPGCVHGRGGRSSGRHGRGRRLVAGACSGAGFGSCSISPCTRRLPSTPTMPAASTSAQSPPDRRTRRWFRPP